MTIDRHDVLLELLAAGRGAADFARNSREGNAFVVGYLKATFSGLPIVAAESDPATYRGFDAERSALFVAVASSSVMLGLAEEGRATVGVVLFTGLGGHRRTYAAAEGIGAFLVGDDGTRSPIHVSNVTDLASVRCIVSGVDRGKNVDAKLQSLGCQELVRIGGGGADCVRVASGEMVLYADPSMIAVALWDSCAPDAIVRAAGGCFTDGRGTAFYYKKPITYGEGTLAGNPVLHAEALRRFRDHDLRTGGATMI